MNAWTEVLDENTYGLYITNRGKYLTFHGNSPGPAVRENYAKTPALIISNSKDITGGLVDALQRAAATLDARMEYL